MSTYSNQVDGVCNAIYRITKDFLKGRYVNIFWQCNPERKSPRGNERPRTKRTAVVADRREICTVFIPDKMSRRNTPSCCLCRPASSRYARRTDFCGLLAELCRICLTLPFDVRLGDGFPSSHEQRVSRDVLRRLRTLGPLEVRHPKLAPTATVHGNNRIALIKTEPTKRFLLLGRHRSDNNQLNYSRL